MKSKITISIEDSILSKIDEFVEKWNWKNRSQVIEDSLKEFYWDFSDMTAIIFAHDYKWDNREYPFSQPKALLEVRKKSVIFRQVELFTESKIKNLVITIPIWTKAQFENELKNKFHNIFIDFLELNPLTLTWDSLKTVLKKFNTNNNLIISNWDIYYWSLDLDSYYSYHKEQRSDFSFLLKFVKNPEQLWNVKINWNKIIDFVERPDANPFFLTNSWLYITTRDFLEKNNYGSYLEKDFFPHIAELGNIIWYIYSWEWEHIQNDSAYERVNWWLM